MPSFIQIEDRFLFPKVISDNKVARLYEKDRRKIFCTSSKNFKVVQKFLLLRKEMEPQKRIYYLFENLSTKNYEDYPAYLFLYGQKMITKKPLITLIKDKEDPELIKILTRKIENLMKFKNSKSIIITFDNFHLIQFKLKGQKLFPKGQIDNIYGVRGKILWINLSTETRFVDFSALKCFGSIYDPFMTWKRSFLESYNWIII